MATNLVNLVDVSVLMCRCFTKISEGLAMANFQCYFDETAKEDKIRLVDDWRECQPAKSGFTTHVRFCTLLLRHAQMCIPSIHATR